MNGKHYIALGGVTLAWILLLLSGAIYMLFWRIDNEPGAQSPTMLLMVAVTLAVIGLIAFIGSGGYLVWKRNRNSLLVALVLFFVVSIIACSISPFLLILMV